MISGGCLYYIYFIQEGDSGPIKIGHAKHPQDRMIQLQTANPRTLHLIAAFPGFVKDEISLHKTLAEHRIRGEWFQPSEVVLAAAKQAGMPKSLRSLDR